MNPTVGAVIFYIFFVVSLALRPCQPFGQRIFYGNVIKYPLSNQKFVVQFNTKSQCQSSYIELISKKGLVKVPCTSVTVKGSAKMNFYTTYIQKCKTSQIQFEEAFYYNVFGWDGSADSPIIPGDQFRNVKLIDPNNIARSVKLIVIGDWSPFDNMPFKTIDKLLLQTQSRQEINGIVILGDVAYDMDQQNGLKYEMFLFQVAETIPTLPIFFVSGNHQHYTADDELLASESFQNYGLSVDMVVGLNLGRLHLVPFDPVKVMYKKVTPAQDKVVVRMREVLKAANANGRFILPFSHYPYRCSGPEHCLEDKQAAIRPYFDAMLDNGVSLYMCGHQHTYQRIYPYYKNGTWSNQKDGYRADGGYLIAIIEGVAGNNEDFVYEVDKVEPFTAYYTISETGIGILQASQKKVNYRHLSTVRGEIDSFDILINSMLRAE